MRRALSRTVRLLVVKATTLAGFLGVATLCGLLCAALAVPLLGSVAYGVSAGAKAVTRLPTTLAVPALKGRTRVYDRTGALVATFFSENRVEVPLTRVAPVMQQAMSVSTSTAPWTSRARYGLWPTTPRAARAPGRAGRRSPSST